jgi:hypothetical protein
LVRLVRPALQPCRRERVDDAVAVDGRDADLEPWGEPGVRVAASQVGQAEQGLTADGQTPPSRTDHPLVSGQLPRQVPQRAASQIDRRRADKHAKLLADTGDLGREPSTRSFIVPHNPCPPTPRRSSQVGKGPLHTPKHADGEYPDEVNGPVKLLAQDAGIAPYGTRTLYRQVRAPELASKQNPVPRNGTDSFMSEIGAQPRAIAWAWAQ